MTASVAWKDYYSVGDQSLDAQHRQMLATIAEVWDAVEQGSDRRAVKPILDRLVRYTFDHFKHEEEVMREHGYPEFLQHKAIHDAIRRKTLALREHATLVTGRDLLQFLKAWWVDHIQKEDKGYAPYLELSGSRT